LVRSRLRESERAMDEALTESPARVETAYHQRAARLAKRQEAQKPFVAGVPAMLLRLGSERYAVELKEVAEVLPFLACTPAPGSPPSFLGMIDLRGELRAVLNMNYLLGIAEGPDGGSGFVLLLRRHSQKIGVKVDGIEDLIEVRPEDLSLPACGKYAKGSGTGAMMMLNLDAVLAEVFPQGGDLTL
jgi:purine-binding chemotaxis protein CheW